jgi:tetratricopeptide (TPR) repeat protein
MESQPRGGSARRRRATIIETPKERRTGAQLKPLHKAGSRDATAQDSRRASTTEGVAPRDVEARLGVLESSGLIRLAQSQPELQYLFRHALVQDAAYHSLVRDDRRAQHLCVGEVLESMYPDRLDELAPVLALHFDEAGDDKRALAYSMRAGDIALRRYANAEAVTHYTHALRVAKRMPTEQALPFLELFTKRGRALELRGHYEQALANYAEMETLAHERGDRTLELAALMARATIHSTPSAVHAPLHGKALSEEALALARDLGDRQAESKILWNLMLLCQFTGHMRDAVAYGEQSLMLARELDLREQLAYTLNDIVRAYLGVGQFARAWLALDEARDIWRALGNLPMLTDNWGRSARIFFAVGEYDRAIIAAEEARRLSESIGNLWGQAFCRMFVGLVYFERGDLAVAIDMMTQCIDVATQAGLVMALVGTRADLAWIYGTLGATENGLALGRLAQATAERLPVFRPWAVGSLARLQVMQGDLEAAAAGVTAGYATLDLEDLSTHGSVHVPMADAELALARQDFAHVIHVTDDLVARLRKVGMRSFLPDALFLKGRALLAVGQFEAAGAALGEARAEAESLGSRRMLWQVLATLSTLAERRQQFAEAQQLRAQARELIAYLAGHMPTTELANMFLLRPAVRAILDAR